MLLSSALLSWITDIIWERKFPEDTTQSEKRLVEGGVLLEQLSLLRSFLFGKLRKVIEECYN